MFTTIALVYGGPGSGKGTLADNLHDKHDWKKCSMSAALREVDATFFGLNILETIDGGGTVEDDIVIPTFHLKLAQHARTAKKGSNLIQEGGFRSFTQVLPQLKIASAYARRVDVFKLDVDEETAVSRILKGQRGRTDDAEHIVRNRVSEFVMKEDRISKRIDRAIAQLGNGKIRHFRIDATQSVATVASFVLHPRTATLFN